MKNRSKYSKRSGETLSLNEDREGATWQEERGPRYGNARKAKAKQKVSDRRSDRRDSKILDLSFLYEKG